MIKQFKDEPVTTWEGPVMGICECGFTAEICGVNPCLRKKIHVAGLIADSKWPEGAPIAPKFQQLDSKDDPTVETKKAT